MCVCLYVWHCVHIYAMCMCVMYARVMHMSHLCMCKYIHTHNYMCVSVGMQVSKYKGSIHHSLQL